jgi:hypothetical protein
MSLCTTGTTPHYQMLVVHPAFFLSSCVLPWDPPRKALVPQTCEQNRPLRACRRFHFLVDCVWNAMAHAQKPDFVFRRYGRVHLNRRGRQFSRLLAAEVCASVIVMLDTPCSDVVCRVLAIHSIRQFPLHFPSRASPCAIRFQLDSTRVILDSSITAILSLNLARLRFYCRCENINLDWLHARCKKD